MLGPKIAWSLTDEENRLLDKIIDQQIEEGLHPDLLENDDAENS